METRPVQTSFLFSVHVSGALLRVPPPPLTVFHRVFVCAGVRAVRVRVCVLVGAAQVGQSRVSGVGRPFCTPFTETLFTAELHILQVKGKAFDSINI